MKRSDERSEKSKKRYMSLSLPAATTVSSTGTSATSDLAALRKVTSDAAAAFSAQRDKAGYAAFGAAAQARAAVLKDAAHVA